MIELPSSLIPIGGARTGIAPVNLLDVQDANGNNYFWADRKISALSALTGVPVAYKAWLLSVPKITFNRSLATDTGNFVIQNVSGNSLARDMETQIRSSAIEGAFFIYRCWQPDAESSWIIFHGTLTLDDGPQDTIQLKGKQLLSAAEDDTPLENYCETCQLQWAGARCGSTQSSECNYSFQSCQVVERPMLVLNDYEKNWGETGANTAMTIINRSRRV